MYKGIEASRGIGIGSICLIVEHDLSFESKHIDDTEAEKARFNSAIDTFKSETAAMAENIRKNIGPKEAEIIGPAECPIEKISQNYRYQILLKGKSVIPLQAAARKLAFEYTHNQNVYIEYDVDPVSLM